MKTLLLLRHGKAVGAEPAGDHDRALNARGEAQAKTVGALLHRLGLDPDLALVSDARRTRETAALVLAGCGSPLEPQFEAGLYDASPEAILAILSEIGSAPRCVLVVGHNPGIGELARRLAGSGEPQGLIGLQSSFPTAALAVIEFNAQSWGELAPGAGSLSRFITPEPAE